MKVINHQSALVEIQFGPHEIVQVELPFASYVDYAVYNYIEMVMGETHAMREGRENYGRWIGISSHEEVRWRLITIYYHT